MVKKNTISIALDCKKMCRREVYRVLGCWSSTTFYGACAARGTWGSILGLSLLCSKSCLLFFPALLQKRTDYAFRFTQLFSEVRARPTNSLSCLHRGGTCTSCWYLVALELLQHVLDSFLANFSTTHCKIQLHVREDHTAIFVAKLLRKSRFQTLFWLGTWPFLGFCLSLSISRARSSMGWPPS